MSTRAVGTKYEELAVRYLEKEGYRIMERNFRGAYGEIDVIAEKDGTIIFFECKYRSQNGYGDPLMAVNTKKQRRISKTALYYFARHGFGMDTPCRFDVIAIYGDDSIRHIENAFEFQG